MKVVSVDLAIGLRAVSLVAAALAVVAGIDDVAAAAEKGFETFAFGNLRC